VGRFGSWMGRFVHFPFWAAKNSFGGHLLTYAYRQMVAAKMAFVKFFIWGRDKTQFFGGEERAGHPCYVPAFLT